MEKCIAFEKTTYGPLMTTTPSNRYGIYPEKNHDRWTEVADPLRETQVNAIEDYEKIKIVESMC